MTAPIDWQAALDGSRPVKTRDGRKVTLYCVDAPGAWPVHGRIEGDHSPQCWKANGGGGGYYDSNIIQPPKRIQREYWVNVYRDFSAFRNTRQDADSLAALATTRRLACVRITIDCEEGEGL